MKRWLAAIDNILFRKLPLPLLLILPCIALGQSFQPEQFRLTLPLSCFQLNCTFGLRNDPLDNSSRQFHSGIDLRVKFEPVYAVLPGNVIKVGKNRIAGKYIIIRHGKYRTIYAHLSRILCIEGSLVLSGTPVAISGNTGRSTGPHLHFGVQRDQTFINPLLFLRLLSLLNDTAINNYLKK